MFTFTTNDLRKLFRLNFFEVPDNPMVFFGLRGCLPSDTDDCMEFRTEHEVELKDTDHKHLRCTIGQWRPKDNTFALFPASTVPHVDYIKKALLKDGAGANQLMTGLYKKYRKGRHQIQRPSSHEAFRMDFNLPIQRTSDDMDFDKDDRVEFARPFDNIHAAYCMGVNHASFASAGCQVIMGFPKTKAPHKHHKNIGPWKVFHKNAYDLDQTNFYYALFNGRDALKVSQFRVDKKMKPRLRYGSHDNAFPKHKKDSPFNLVSALQRALKEKDFYLGAIDGDFGGGSFNAIVDFQTDQFGTGSGDGIVGPITAEALGIEWPMGDFSKDQPFG